MIEGRFTSDRTAGLLNFLAHAMGSSPALDAVAIFAPLLSSKRTISGSGRSEAMAQVKGVMPRTSVASTEAPASISIFITDGLEAAVARCSAVKLPNATGRFWHCRRGLEISR